MMDQKLLVNVEYFNCLDSMIASGAICTRASESRIAVAKQHSTKFTSKLDINLRKNLVKCYVLTYIHTYIYTFLVNDQRDAQFFSMCLSLFFNSLHISSTSCSSSGERNCVNTTSGSCHCVSVAVSSADDTATDTERVKYKDKYIEKNCVLRWAFTKNHYTMHGQQNINYKIRTYIHTYIHIYIYIYSVDP